MNGVVAARSVLVSSAAVTALVPSQQVIAGLLPQGVVLPAIALLSISAVSRSIPNPGTLRHVSERVQVSVAAPDYPTQKAILKAVRAACDSVMPDVAGLSRVTIHLDSAGPDFTNDETSIHFGSQDLKITFSEPR